MDMDRAKHAYDREVTKLLNEIQNILARDGKTIADLAREIRRSYQQTYAWLVVRRFNPSGKGLMILRAWRDKQISRTANASALAGTV